MDRTQTLTLTTLALLLVTSFLTLTAQAATTQTFTVTQSTYQVTFNLPVGTAFNGSLTTTNTVRVWVNDPNGTLIANPGLVDSNADFSFTAAKEGAYYVNFENPMSSMAKVTFTYETDPELPNDSQPLLPLSLWPVFAVVAIAACLAVFYLIRRRRRLAEE